MRVRCAPTLWLAPTVFVLGIAAARDAAPLADAVQRADNQAVQSLLKAHADVNAPQRDGATALHWAAYLNDADTTALLIRAGASVDSANNYGVTPLALAAGNGNAAVINLLLKGGADPNRAVRAGETPLMLAARTDRADAVKALLEGGANVNAKESWNGQTALMWAAAAGHGTVVQALIDRGADVHARSNAGTTPLIFAVRRGDMAAVRALLAAGADVAEKRPDGAAPLLVAVINGHADLVDLLLDKGADPNVEGGSTELTVQGVRARPMELKYRKLTNNERDSEGVTRGNIFGKPLHAAVHVANWHTSDQFIAVQFDRIRVITSLLAHGADVDGRISMEEPRWSGARYRRHLAGATAFLLAAKAADVAVMRLLLAHGADPTINTEENITPLMAAAGIAWASNQDRASESQVLEAVTLMVDEVGADVNAVSDLGETAMHAAAYRGANSVVQYLFDKGAKLDVVAIDGRTPLIVADGVEYGNSFAAQPQTAALLRKLGAKEMTCPSPCAAAIPEGKEIKR
ncbi:MAG TPA: ankyrin repeat domain-containing protein [Vicinamibacterales bacterium]|nr:ankyrin repeat domain-containing protein [Vicinamibacterales bacterium]